MLNTLKKDFLDSLNILSEIALNSKENFPNELCRFLSNEFDLRYSFFSKESSQNQFNKLGSSGIPDFTDGNIFTIVNYNSVFESTQLENDLIIECQLELSVSKSDLKSYFISAKDKNYLLILAFKTSSVPGSFQEIYPILKFIQNILKIWDNNNNTQASLNNSEVISLGLQGLLKDIKTVNGLTTLISEEHVSSAISKYLNEVRKQNNITLASLNDLLSIVELNKSYYPTDEIVSLKKDLFETFKNKINNPNISINCVSDKEYNVKISKELLDDVIFNIITFLSGVTSNNNISIECKESISGNLIISIKTFTGKIHNTSLDEIFLPYKNKSIVKNQSGLALVYAKEVIEKFSGQIKFNLINNELAVNISLPLEESAIDNDISRLNELNNEKKDKILVIESDPASSSLLKNYLTKWNYGADFVSSGEYALKLLSEKNYVAVIINVEQENENSLELIQKIKNNKATRNTPVIVFSIEKEEEKIYTMGSVDYLVKPINYNYLVEILTSYKLRRNSTVLCVDDDLPTLNLVKQAVQTAGCKVIAESRPETVIDQIYDKDIELAIIDLDMPVLNGFDLIKQIKSIDKFEKLPIIIYTGKEDYAEDLRKIDGMFVELLSKKSTSFDQLEKTITSMINQYEETKTPSSIMDSGEGPKILMAEDYKHSQIIVTRLLKKNGFENVIVVENGQEALNICENDKIDLILMDMQMPIMNGFEATGRIRELEGYEDTPIIALTAFAMKGDREKCLEAGATDYIPKPIDSKEFIEKVKYYTQVNV